MYNNSTIDEKIKQNGRIKREFDKIYDKIDGNSVWYSSGKYEITTNEGATFDFYVSTNTIVCRQSKRTYIEALKWINNNLIKKGV